MPQLLLTNDGSHTLHHAELNETYHSKHGAIQESEHVFIKAGLQYYLGKNPLKTEINILEVGFGTGLNALLTFLAAEKSGCKINYTTLEAFPLHTEIINQLNYPGLLPGTNAESIFSQLHICPWEKMLLLGNNFSFQKLKTTLQSYTTVTLYDIIFFDAFAPGVQPELWTTEIFDKLYRQMCKNAVLVTYCAKGDVRRNLLQVGFMVERLPGPPGKREMLRARKPGIK